MGGSSKKTTVGYKYYVGMHMALCHGPVDKLVRIRVGGKDAWVGDCTGGELAIDKPDLFGGEKREGGVSGQVDIEMGGPTQGQNSYLAAKLGADLLPAFRGVCCAVLRQVYIGLNPYLKDWGWLCQRIHKRQNGEVQWYDEKAKIGTYTVSDSWPPSYQEGEVSLNSYDITVPDGSLEGVFTNGGAGLLHNPTKQAYGVAWADWNGTITSNVSAIYFSFMLHVRTPYEPAAVLHFFNAEGNSVTTFVSNDGYGDTWFMGVKLSPSPLELNTLYSVKIDQINDTQVSVDLSGNGFQLDAPIVINQSIKNIRDYRIGFNQIPYGYINASSVSYGKFTIYQDQAEPGGDVYGGYSDMNPAHIIRECLTDANWGMGYPEADMGDSFTTAADTLYGEEMGISILWSQQTSIEDFVEEILRHIDAALYVDRTTGKFELKLIRDDYDESSLLILDQSNISRVEGYSKQTLAELANEITVTYNSNETGQTETVTMQNLAMIQQQGAIIPASVEYMGFASQAIAAKAAARDLKAMSTPLVSATIYANREAAGLNIGSVFRWNWTETDEEGNGIATSYIMRVTEIALGDGVDNTVRIQCVQDVFALPDIVYVSAPKTAWVDPNDPNVLVPLDPNDPDSPLVPNPTAAPQPALPRLVWEAPYYDLAFQLGDKGAQAAISDGECFLAVAAGRQGQELNADILVDSGAGYDDGGVLDFCPYAYIRDAWEWDTLGGFVDKPTAMAAAIGRYASLGDEIVWVYDVSAANVVTVRRGCLDTIPHAHAAGTPLIVWHGFSTSDDVEYANGDEVAVKIITAAGVATLSESSAPVNTVTMEQRASRPYPPACVKIAGEWFPTEVLAAETGFDVSWHHRDRLLQTATPTIDTINASKWSAETDIGPEPGVTYGGQVVAIPSHALLAEFGPVTDNNIVVAPSAWGNVRIELWSERDGLRCLHPYSHDFVYTGAKYETDSTTPISGNLLEGTTGLTISQVNSDPLNVGIDVAGSNGGLFRIYANGSWTFDPNSEFGALFYPETVDTSVTYHASDGTAEAMRTLTVTVDISTQQPWTPADIITALWVDASDVASVSIDSGRVSTWADKSGQGKHLSQTTPSYRMGYNSGIAVMGDSTSTFRFMDAPSPITIRTIIMVFNWTDTSGNYRHVLSAGTTFHGNTASFNRMFHSSYTHTYVRSGAGRINGTAVAPLNMPRYTNKTIFSLVTTADVPLRGVGGWQDTFGYRAFYGNYHEIICSSFVLSTEEIQKTEGYLAHKWDALLGVTTLVDALPSDHPYKSAPPTI